MQHLGHTRSSYQRDHLLHTPDTFVRAALPGMKNATAIVHAGPAIGAGFTQYTAELDPDGSLRPGTGQCFLYVLEGSIVLSGIVMSKGQYCWLPPGSQTSVNAKEPARVAVIEKIYSVVGEVTPGQVTGDERSVPSKPLLDDDAIQVRTLLPDDPAFDCAVNTMTLSAWRQFADGGNPHHGTWPSYARRRGHLPVRRALVSGQSRRFHLDGAVLPAVVRCARKGACEIPHL